MKKNNLIFGTAAVILLSGLTACGGGKFTPDAKVTEAIAEAQTLTQDQLFEKAAAELGASGQLKVLATTSRGGKPAVANLFKEKLQAYNAEISDPLKYDTVVDGVIYTNLVSEIQAKATDGYDCAVLQDGYQLQKKGLDTNYFVNFIPKEWKEGTGVNVAQDGNPMTLQYNFKTWMYNKKANDINIDNVWDVTHSKFKGKIDTMNPANENVNMDWLIQLTDDAQVAKLKAAYEAESADTDVDLTKYADKGEKKYAYAFIDRFIENAVFYEDDGKAMTHLAATPGNIGWIVYSKLLKVEESADVSKSNIVIGSLGANWTGNTEIASSMKGFGGFMYKHYLQVMPLTKHPYAAAAFLSLISTNATAYSVWAGDVGDYPTLPGINKDRSRGGYVTEGETEVNKFPCLNDPESNWWLNKADCVVETPSFIGPNYDKVIGFISAAIAKK